MNIFEWEDGMSVTASDMNDMQNILNNNITNAIANQVVSTTGGNAVATGRIIDGRPEYVKRIDLGTFPSSGTKDVAIGTVITQLVKLEGSAYRSSDGTSFPLPFTSTDTSSNIGIWVQSREYIRIAVGTNRSNLVGWVDVYYT